MYIALALLGEPVLLFFIFFFPEYKVRTVSAAGANKRQ